MYGLVYSALIYEETSTGIAYTLIKLLPIAGGLALRGFNLFKK